MHKGQRPDTSLMFLLALCQLLVVVDGTVVNLALPVIASEFGVGMVLAAWVSTSYLLAIAGFVMICGRASDVVGHKRMLIAGIAVFTAASIGCACSQSLPQLVIFRAAQGLGSAMISPAVLSLITFSFSDTHRVQALTTYNIVSSAGAAAGLVAGGLITQALSWRLVFAINIPLGAALLWIATRRLTNVKSVSTQFNLFASGLSVFGVIFSVYGLLEIGRAGLSERAIGGSAIGAICIFCLIVLEVRSKNPIVPIEAVRERAVYGGLVIRLLVSGSMFGSLYFISFLLRDQLGLTPAKCAVALLPIPLVSTICSKASQRLLRNVEAPRVILAGLALLSFGALWLGAVLKIHQLPLSYVVLLPGVCFLASGVGLSFPALGTMVLLRADSFAGVRSALFSLAQQIGNPVGLAAMIGLSAITVASSNYHNSLPVSQSPSYFSVAFTLASATSALAAIGCYIFLVRKKCECAPDAEE